VKLVLDMVYPPSCPVCQNTLGFDSGKRIYIHKYCKRQLVYIGKCRCLKCGKEIRDENLQYCYDCKKINHIFEQGIAVYKYTDGIKQSIYQYKYKNKREYATFYAKEIYRNCYQAFNMWQPDIIIPVPLHKSKYKIRGFNQAQLISEQLSRLTNIPTDDKILIRNRKTTPMKELNDKERLKNLKNAFIIGENIVKYKKVLIVDDIYTTGSTIDECSKVLKSNGVEQVYFVCLCIGDGF
jgi:ComF family protein